MAARSTNREYLIVIEDGPNNIPRKAARLITMGDGSFAISAPYHPARTGILAKIGAPHVLVKDGLGQVSPEQRHQVNALVKLTYHVSGFVQFSSAGKGKITSGRTGPESFLQPKGIGIHSQPLTDPIETGPSLGLRLFDLKECDHYERRRSDPTTMVFTDRDFFERDEHVAGERHVYSVSFFVFPIASRRTAVLDQGRWVLETGYGSERPNWIVRFRVVDLRTQFAFLGVVVERSHTGPDEHRQPASGYSMSGPRDIGSGLWPVGMFPAQDKDKAPSLDFVAAPGVLVSTLPNSRPVSPASPPGPDAGIDVVAGDADGALAGDQVTFRSDPARPITREEAKK